MNKAEEDAAFNLNKRRGIAQEKREAKMEKDEAEKYQMLKDELVMKSFNLTFSKFSGLFSNLYCR